MTQKGIVAAIAAGLIAVWLFLSLTDTQMADRTVQQAQFDRDAAEFDRDFAKDKFGSANDDLEKRTVEAQQKLEKAVEEQHVVDGNEGAKRKALKGAVEDDIKDQTDGTVDLKAVGKSLID